MRIALDTNAYSDFMRGSSARAQIVRTAHEILVPLIVLGELRAGFASGNQRSANAANLRRFLNSPRVSILNPDEQTTHHYGHLFRQLREAGTPIPSNDLWIASLVIQHELVLCTADAHYQSLPQLITC